MLNNWHCTALYRLHISTTSVLDCKRLPHFAPSQSACNMQSNALTACCQPWQSTAFCWGPGQQLPQQLLKEVLGNSGLKERQPELQLLGLLLEGGWLLSAG